MPLRIFIIAFLPVVCFGDKPYNGEFREDETDGYSTGNMENGKLHGEWKEFRYDLENSNGEYLYSVGNYKDGKQHGEWKWFYENGDLSSVRNYKDGRLHGTAKRFHENGNLNSMENYDDGKPHREWKEFDEDGNLEFVKNYKNGKNDGEWKSFYKNGKLKLVENYKDGKPHGEWKEFDEDGKLIVAENTNYGTKGTFTDKRDGKKYKTIKISIQTWMAENLNYDESGSVCYENKSENCNKYGRLYNYRDAANEVCPSGWHLPNNEEWQKLVDIAGGYDIAGKKLKAKKGWADNGNGNSTDEYGFSALPGGKGNSDGLFDYAGYNGNWWSASESELDTNGAYIWQMGHNFEYASYHWDNKSGLLSVRCVQDLESGSPTAETCNAETNKAKQIYARCVRMGKTSNGYAECANDYNNQKTKAQQVCKSVAK